MRYAILSDVHSNLEALTAVLDSLAPEHIDRYLCLGDTLGYGADPAPCLERLSALGAVIVAGNHDLACLGAFDLQWFNDVARAAVIWTRGRLGPAELETIRRLPLTAIEGPFTLVHGTLTHPERFEYLLELAQAIDTLAACQTLVCLVGHTHLPYVVEFDLGRWRVTRALSKPGELSDVAYEDRPEALRYLINPGSVGQPRDGDPRASCALVDTERRTASIRRVAYDVATAQRKIREAGLPEFLAQRLSIGR
jgi:diadenosine tetraphosphatase ApaH/serine/threonine PP2A family protein phosphatase